VANCINCGAPLRPDAATRALVCGHCGTLESDPALVPHLEIVGASRAPCPLCQVLLSDSRLEGHALLSCAQCHGLLIPMAQFVAVIEIARSHEERTGVALPRRQRPGERTLSCPTCAAPMLSHVYAGPGNLVIDTCERCAVNWLDPGELRRIARAPQGRVWSPPPLREPAVPDLDAEED
jgi:Zn-finger nucleic acid-binding protein